MSSHLHDMTRAQALEGLGPATVHGNTVLVAESPLRVVTPQQQWSYAATYALQLDTAAAESLYQFGGGVVVTLTVLRGCIGVGVTTETGDAFIVEKFAADGPRQMSLPIPARARAGAVVLRNGSESGSSEFIVTAVHVRSRESDFVYPVEVTTRGYSEETVPRDGDVVTAFDSTAAQRINIARLRWLEAANLVPRGARVLDAGAGVGHFVPFYESHACTIVALEGRAENVAALRRRHPAVDVHIADVQRLPPGSLGRFDVIHCFGLLYHLESPIAALRLFREVCDGILILETIVCDSSRPVCVLADESKAANQALDGLGCRPSPAFLALALNRVGFRYVYGANPPPQHEDFQFTWRDNLETSRDDHPLRCIFVAADVPISRPSLIPVVD